MSGPFAPDGSLLWDETPDGCCVCQHVLEWSIPSLTGEIRTCPRCGIVNVRTQSGRANRPERLAIYHEYDGDPYDPRQAGGRQGALVRAAEQQRLEVQLALDAGEITEAEAATRRRRITRLLNASATALRQAKRTALNALIDEERAIRRRLDADAGAAPRAR